MTKFLILLNLALFLALYKGLDAQNVNEEYLDSLHQLRVNKQLEMTSRKESPLLKEDRKKFGALDFFPLNEDWRVDAFYFRIENGAIYNVATSSGAVKQFQKHGFFVFQVFGQLDTLFAFERVYPDGYRPTHAPYLFIPFKDHSTGEDTYGGGRYLDTPVYNEDQRVKLDFNLAYNPYCAYGSGFSCPIPPEENFVNFRVEAGEKTYEKKKSD